MISKLILAFAFLIKYQNCFFDREIPFWLLRMLVLCLKFKIWLGVVGVQHLQFSPFTYRFGRPNRLWLFTLTLVFPYSRCHITSTDTTTWVDDLDSRFLLLTNATNHFCCLIHSNLAFDYKATFCKKLKCQNWIQF